LLRFSFGFLFFYVYCYVFFEFGDDVEHFIPSNDESLLNRLVDVQLSISEPSKAVLYSCFFFVFFGFGVEGNNLESLMHSISNGVSALLRCR
ncbi:hypothetical protein M569_02014, partial [Genlisea aurea]